LGGSWFQISLGKKSSQNSHLNGEKKKLGMAACACHPSDHCPGWPRQKERPYLKNNQSKRDRRHGSSDRAHVLQTETLISNARTKKKRMAINGATVDTLKKPVLVSFL
jgi:hypothetical protein